MAKRRWGWVGLAAMVAGLSSAPAGADEGKFETTACHIVCENLTTDEWKWTCVEVIDVPLCDVDEAIVDDACERAWPPGSQTNADEARTEVVAGDPFPPDAHCWDRQPDYGDDDFAPYQVDACTEDPELELFDVQLGQTFKFEEGTYMSAKGNWLLAGSRKRCSGPDWENPDKPDPNDYPCCTEDKTELSGALSVEVDPPLVSKFRFGGSVELTGDGAWCKQATCGSEGKWLCDGEEEPHAHAGQDDVEHEACSSDKVSLKGKLQTSIPVDVVNWGIFKITGRGQLSGGARKVTTRRSGKSTCAGCCESGVNPEGLEVGLNATLTGTAALELDLKLFKLEAEADLLEGCVDWTDHVIPSCDGSTLEENELDAYAGALCQLRFGGSNGATDVDQGVCVGFGWFKTCWKWTPPDGQCLLNIGDPSSC